MLIALWGGCLLCAHMLSALNINSLSLGKNAIDVKEGEALFIPCHYDTDKDGMDNKEKPRNVLVEWGHFETSNGVYTPVIRVLNSYLEALPEPNPYADRALMFLSLFNTGSCSLVVNPTFQNDSGTYEVKVFYNGELYQKSPTIKVHIKVNNARTGEVNGQSRRPWKHKRRARITHSTTKPKTTIKPRPEEEVETVPPLEIEPPSESIMQEPSEEVYEDFVAANKQKPSEADAKANTKDQSLSANKDHPSMPEEEEEMYSKPVGETKHKATGKFKGSGHSHAKKRRQGLAAQNDYQSTDSNGLEKSSQVPVMAIIYIALAIALLFFLGCVIGCIFCLIYIRRENHRNKKHHDSKDAQFDTKETQSFEDSSSVGSNENENHSLGSPNHGTVDLGTANHGPDDHRSSDHGPADRRSADHGPADRRSADHGPADRRSADHGPADRRSTDHGPADRRSTDHGPADRRSTDHGPADRRSTDHGPGDRGSADRASVHRGSAKLESPTHTYISEGEND